MARTLVGDDEAHTRRLIAAVLDGAGHESCFCEVVEVHHVVSQQVLILVLRCGDNLIGYYDLLLTYEEAQISPRDAWTLAKIARTTKQARWFQSDLFFHELDRTEEGLVEHRLLFHPGLWFAVRCRNLRWDKIDRPGRELPALADRFPGGPSAPPSKARRKHLKAEREA
jgi:hypothetical protein